MPALTDLLTPTEDQARVERKRLKKESKRKAKELFAATATVAAEVEENTNENEITPASINNKKNVEEIRINEENEKEQKLIAERKLAKKAAKRKRRKEEAARAIEEAAEENNQLISPLPPTPTPTLLTTSTITNNFSTENNQSQKKKKQKKNFNDSISVPIATTFFSSTSSTDALAYRKENSINITPADSHILPITNFSQLSLPSYLLNCLSSFISPTPIQSQCWPVLLDGRDVIAIAETGSGKTLGFALPGINHILSIQQQFKNNGSSSNKTGPIMLVLSPTRELATQTKDVILNVISSLPTPLNATVIYGGVDKYSQEQSIRNRIQILVACPGRLLSFLEEGKLSLTEISFLVLDEADRMLDMGFEPDIRKILNYCNHSKRQTAMFSATWPTNVEKLASEFIRNPVQITIGAIDLKANHRVTQTIEVMDNNNDYFKQQRLLSLLNLHHANRIDRIIVFVLYKREVDLIERFLLKNNWKCIGISGDRNQLQRTQAINNFKQGIIPILVATDVAARGLDIPNVECVINYTFPLTVEDYVHRIGRTGRAGKNGISITFFSKNEKHLSGELINVLREANEPVPEELLKFGTAVKKKEHGMYGAFFKAEDELPMKKSVKVKF